jgi:hypothetical protein
MLLAAAILSSIGGLAILAGAWVQAREAYSAYKAHRDVKVWVDDKDKTPDPRHDSPRSGGYVSVTICAGPHFLGADPEGSLGEVPVKLRFLPTPRTLFQQQTFAGWYGWNLVFVGGTLVLAGSVVAAIAAA